MQAPSCKNNGNRTQKVTTAATIDYLYDVRDQLTKITQGGSSIGQFLYDYQGLRVQKQTQAGITHYLYDDQSVLIQSNEQGTTQHKYNYGPNQLLSLKPTEKTAQFYHFDALGSPVHLSNVDGSIAVNYQYDAFGQTTQQTGDSGNVFGFTGHEKDSESGLYYFKANEKRDSLFFVAD